MKPHQAGEVRLSSLWLWLAEAGGYALRAVGYLSVGKEPTSYPLTNPDKATGRNSGRKIMAAVITEVSGIVEAVNPKGFKIQGRDTWLNYSNYDYQGPAAGLPAPTVGQNIAATLKQGKYLVTLTIGGVATPVPQPQAQVISQPVMPRAVQPTPQTGDISALDRLIVETRLSILKTMAVAQPNLFTMADGDTVVEMGRNFELYVLADILPTPIDESDVTADDLIDEED